MSKAISSTTKRLNQTVRAARIVNRRELASEARLSTTKWFGYRFMSPFQATVEFANAFTTVFKHQFRRIDVSRVDAVSGVNGAALDDSAVVNTDRTQLWMARQRADLTGMRYKEYIDASMEFGQNRQRNYLPRPGQLHHPDKAWDHWCQFRENYWRDRLDGGAVEMPSDPAYRVENFRGLPAQIAYREFLVDQIRGSTRPIAHSMQEYVIALRQLPIEAFDALLPADARQWAIENLETEQQHSPVVAQQLVPFERDQLWINCFGLPGVYDAGESACQSCTVTAQCLRIAAFVSSELQVAIGTTTPVDDDFRRKARDRKRLERKRKALPKNPAGITNPHPPATGNTPTAST